MISSHAFYDNFYAILQWEKIAGKLKWIAVSQNFVIGVNSNNDIYYRAGINNANTKGLHWVKVAGKLSQIDVHGNFVWGANCGFNVYYLQLSCEGKICTHHISGYNNIVLTQFHGISTKTK